MRDKLSQAVDNATPTYALYGEFLEQARPDFLHFETIRERSIKHSWSIKPHRHDRLLQVFLFESAGVHIRIGEDEVVTDGPISMIVPPLITHGFQFLPTVEGCVVSIEMGTLMHMVEGKDIPFLLLQNPLKMTSDHKLFSRIVSKFAAIEDDFKSVQPYRNLVLENEFMGILICFAKTFQDRIEIENPQAVTRQEKHVREFCALLEANYKTSKPIGFYADAVGLSSVQLNRLCREVLNLTPNTAIAVRRTKEAKRLLKYTQYTISDIADQLGFEDIGYFSRFFKKHTGLSPRQYRQDVCI